MSTNKRIDFYEEGVVESLEDEFGYSKKEAESIVIEYRQIMELIGGYPTVSDYAEYFNRAKESGRTKEDWIKHIMSNREEAVALLSTFHKRDLL